MSTVVPVQVGLDKRTSTGASTYVRGDDKREGIKRKSTPPFRRFPEGTILPFNRPKRYPFGGVRRSFAYELSSVF